MIHSIEESKAAFAQIAQKGIPIRNPKGVMGWARMALYSAYKEFGAKYQGTVVGVERPFFITESDWKRGIEEGWLYCMLVPSKISYNYLLWYADTLQTKNGWLDVMKQVEKHEGDGVFGGNLYALLKKQMRLQGLCGSWLKNYDPKKGRVFYGSLNPLGCSTGRCAPRPSDGFLPGMGKEITNALLQAPKGRCVYELDFKAQGLCILAALSHDPVMDKLARASKDPYLALSMCIGAIPMEDYQNLSVDALKVKYQRDRDQTKTLMLAYQYGAGSEALEALASPLVGQRCRQIKRGLDSLFRVYKDWLCALSPDSFILPDGFKAEGKSPAPTLVQGWDSYILRQLVSSVGGVLPPDTFVIATNHDSVWIEAPEGENMTQVATFMENLANEALKAEGLFRVCVEKIG